MGIKAHLQQESGWALAVLTELSLTVKVWLGQPYPLGSKLQLHCATADPFNSLLEFKDTYQGMDEKAHMSQDEDKSDVDAKLESTSVE